MQFSKFLFYSMIYEVYIAKQKALGSNIKIQIIGISIVLNKISIGRIQNRICNLELQIN